MRFPKTVESKPIITDKNGEAIRDLTTQSLKDNEFIYVDMMAVPRDFIMRPELIAHLRMGNVDKLEILLKANEISNPFSIDENDIMLIPEVITSDKKFVTELVGGDVRKIIKKQYIDPKKSDIKNTGDNYEDYRDREKTMLPPNYAKEDDKEFVLTGGKIVLGPYVTKKAYKGDVPLAKQRFLEKMQELRK